MFSVSCNTFLLWHPAVHHSLLLLRALQQCHTLVLKPDPPGVVKPNRIPYASQCGNNLSIVSPSGWGNVCTSTPVLKEGTLPLLRGSECGLQRVHDPQHILYFFSPASMQRQCELKDQFQSYLSAVVVGGQILRAVDDLVMTSSIGNMEAERQAHSILIDRIGALDASLQEGDTGKDGSESNGMHEVKRWSTWPLYTAMQFVVEEAGLPLGPFPRMAEAYKRLRGSKEVAAHMKLVQRTLAQINVSAGVAEGPLHWPYRGLLREVQRRIADYAELPCMGDIANTVGEKGPLRERVSGARFGLQHTPTRTPWTMQGYH
uniref:Uncharacterized protein TCIL3000_4_3960 n=1 Tax=Trypanosoma congolense (strain IL3000) TaxID=1068625 RepID=G0ULN1_TRYCI|nr:unnamed protein product [Trypanosoma congolense IL3000]